jgi:hypothetical protein
MKILILGGYGVFGGRLAELLADLAPLELLICGRDEGRAKAFCNAYAGPAVVRPVKLDRADIAEALGKYLPDLVVDASGPFQNYGADCYSVIEACITAGTDYLDFADAADFVFGVPQCDEAARQAGVFVLSGVSSFPVLTAAVLREFASQMDVVTVEGGIAPSPYAGIGLNVMRAVIGNAGAPVKLLRDGKPSHGIGLAESRRYTIAVPGKLPLRNIHFSLVDVPDLQVIPPEHLAMTDIWMGAGPVPEILHRVLNLLARARATFRLPTLVPLSRLFYAVLNLMKFGEHRGGMFVRATGLRGGRPVEVSWHLLAEGDDGPYIPSMAIEGIIRKLLAGERPINGARTGTHALELSDYDRLFAGRSITSGIRREENGLPLYRALLGPSFAALPHSVQTLHDSRERRSWSGTALVRPGTGLLARIVRTIIGFPGQSGECPVRVEFEPGPTGERWTRTFGSKSFQSLQSGGKGRNQFLLVETFGLVSVSLALVVEDGRMRLVPRRWSLFGMPMPKWLLPNGTSQEFEQGDRFRFDVEIAMPLIGRVVAYKGVLEPDGG